MILPVQGATATAPSHDLHVRHWQLKG